MPTAPKPAVTSPATTKPAASTALGANAAKPADTHDPVPVAADSLYDEALPAGFWDDDADSAPAQRRDTGAEYAPADSADEDDMVYPEAFADRADAHTEARASSQPADILSSDLRQSPLFSSLQSLFPGRVLEYNPATKASATEDDSDNDSSATAYDPDDEADDEADDDSA